MAESPPRHFEFDGYRADRQTRQLCGPDGKPVALTAKAFDTLCYLVEHRARTVGKDELLASVWPGRVVEENNLTQAISALRRAFGVGAGDHRFILTVPGRGYRFVAEVREADDVAEATLQEAAGIADVRTRRAGYHLMWWALLVAALLAAIVLFAWASWTARPSSPATAVVLPFRTLSRQPQDQLLAMGLAETLIARLSGSSSMRVRTLASAERAVGDNADGLAAGRRLDAAYVIEGSAEQHGQLVRVNARVLRVLDGTAVWAGTFDGESNRIFALQDNLAAAVTTALGLGTDDRTYRRSPCEGKDAAAHHAYLTGRYLVQRPDPSRLPDAMAAFRRAIDHDPACARAYAGLAQIYRSLVITSGHAPRDTFPLAKAAAEHALRIDPTQADAHAALSFVRAWYDWDWPGAEASARQAIEANPSLPEAHFALAHLLVNEGRFDEGLAHAQQAYELDPLSPLINAIQGGFLSAAQRNAEAQTKLQQALELEPAFWIAWMIRGGMAMERGDTEAALDAHTRAVDLSRGNSQALALLGVAKANAGDRAGAEAILRDLHARRQAGYVPATALAVMYDALGDTDQAFDMLERAYQERDVRLAFLQTDARWNSLRADARFDALAERLRLQTPPRAYGRF